MVSGTAVRFGSSRFGLRVKPMQTGFTLEPIEGNRFGGETESQVKPNRLSEPLPSLAAGGRKKIRKNFFRRLL